MIHRLAQLDLTDDDIAAIEDIVTTHRRRNP
jgi:hypothetical protein